MDKMNRKSTAIRIEKTKQHMANVFILLSSCLILSACNLQGSIMKGKLSAPSLPSGPTIEFKQNQITLVEGESYDAEIDLSTAQTGDVEIHLALSSTDGINRLSPLPSTLRIPAGQTSAVLSLVTIDDAIVQPEQSWVVTLTYFGGDISIPNRDLLITLKDNDGGTTPGAGTTMAGPILLKSLNSAPASISRAKMNDGKVIYKGTDASHGSELWVSDGTALGTFLVKDIYPGTRSSNPDHFYLNSAQNTVYFTAETAAEGIELWKTDGTATGTVLVKDINVGTGTSAIHSFEGQLGTATFFKAYTVASGTELWTTDGTEAGTQMLLESGPGTADVHLSNLTVFNGAMYFGTGTNGFYLYKTDGTPAGTSVVYTFTAGATVRNPQCLLVFNSKLFFMGYDATNDGELWVSDGTAGGTSMVKNINTSGSSEACPIGSVSGKLIFTAMDATYSNKLWATDGTSAGTIQLDSGVTSGTGFGSVNGKFIYTTDEPKATDGTLAGTILLKNINPSASSYASAVGALGSLFIFKADDGTSGVELWVTDGTAAGTQILKDILPGSQSSNPNDFQFVGSKMFFSAKSPTGGRELWVTDGTPAGTSEFIDLYSGSGSSSPKNLLAIDSTRFFFTAYNSSASAATIYFSDSTVSGTQAIPNSMIETGNSLMTSVSGMVEASGTIYFSGAENGLGQQVWKTNGTEGTTSRVIDFDPLSESDPIDLFSFAGSILIGSTTIAEGTEMWTTDGTSAGTQFLKEADPGGGNYSLYGYSRTAASATKFLYFQPSTTLGLEPWITDGTTAGTGLLKELKAGTASFNVSQVDYNSTLDRFFMTEDLTKSLWVTDGSTVGTVDLSTAVNGVSYSASILRSGNSAKTFILLSDPFTDFMNGGTAELWVSDGTLAGTTKISPVAGFLVKNANYSILLPNGKLVFLATDGASGIEPWVSDGTSAGTFQLKDINSGAGNSVGLSSFFFSMGNQIIFNATTPVGVWVTDGTTAGTQQIVSSVSLTAVAVAKATAGVGGTYFFSATTASEGAEIWKTDGTAAGTSLLKDINPGTASSSPKEFTVFNGKVYFSAADPTYGRELWVTDGTAAGTQMVMDINPGYADSSPDSMKVLGGNLYMLATKVLLGRELWVMAP